MGGVLTCTIAVWDGVCCLCRNSLYSNWRLPLFFHGPSLQACTPCHRGSDVAAPHPALCRRLGNCSSCTLNGCRCSIDCGRLSHLHLERSSSDSSDSGRKSVPCMSLEQ